jgi:hypothetical protein
LLLHEHRQAEPQLDAIRRRVIDQECRQRPSPPGFRIRLAAARLWNELIVPYRRAWIGIASVWMLISSLHVTQPRPIERPVDASTLAASSVEALLKEQVHLRAELLGLTEALPDGKAAEDRRRWEGPRSEHLGPNLHPGSNGALCLRSRGYLLEWDLRAAQRNGKYRTDET